MAGAFARDSRGQLCIVHSGKIGGGRKGIGQTAFLAQSRGAKVPVSFVDARTFEMVLIGVVGSARFRATVRDFVQEVDRVKALLVDGSGSVSGSDKFTPEFAGKKRSYLPDAPVETVATHGLVVSQLAKLLEEQGRTPHNDRNRDLYLGTGDQASHLFEIKTDLTTTSIYTAVGQLMLHGAAMNGLRRILVIPGVPGRALAQKLESLEITVLTYSWKGDQPIITGLSDLL